MQQFELHALHGFLGKPNDWDFLYRKGTCVDLFSDESISNATFYQWAKWYNSRVKNSASPKLLVGYSMGGRLALHSLLQSDHLWSGAILISTHPGLKTENEQSRRVENDQRWAEKFKDWPWKRVMNEWNGQPVFARNRATVERKEDEYNKETLSRALLQWSLGKQENLTPSLGELTIPVLWIVGENDIRYTKIARSLTFKNPISKVLIASECGHRIPWTHTDLLNREIKNFEEELCQPKLMSGKL